MSKINDTSHSKEFFYEEEIKNKLYNLYLLINPKESNKNGLNITKYTVDDLLKIIQNSIQSILSAVNDNYLSNQLENHIIKLESDIRHFTKREFQFKIQKDALEMKIRAYMCIEEEYELLKEKVRYDAGKFLNNDRKDNEIIILRQENSLLKKEIEKNEKKNKELSDIIKKDQDIINALKYKNAQLSKIINELKNIKSNNNINNIHNNSSINLNIINNNNGNKNNSIISNSNKKLYNMNLTKKYIETLNKNHKNNNLQFKQKLTLYHSPKITYQFDINNKNKNKIEKKIKIANTIDNNNLFISTYNKIFNNNTINNNKNRNKKFKGSSISMRLEDNEKSDVINKYLSINNSTSKYMSSIKTKSYNKISKSIPKYKVPLSNKNESFINNYGNIRHSMSKKTFRKEKRLNEHASFIIKRVTKNK